MNWFNAIIIGFLSLVLIGCGDTPYYQDAKTINEAWSLADSIKFEMPAPDTSLAYSMSLDIEHTDEYPFQNLYIRLSTQFPSGKRASDLINIDLADKAGQWYGKCGRSSCSLTAVLRDNFSFSESGVYNITIEQYTRQDPLPGVRKIQLDLWQY